MQDRQTGIEERTTDQPEAFGRLLQRLRTRHTLTQAALAQQASCAIDTIKKIEAGARHPSPRLAAQLADCLGLAGDERAAFLAPQTFGNAAAGSTSATRA